MKNLSNLKISLQGECGLYCAHVLYHAYIILNVNIFNDNVKVRICTLLLQYHVELVVALHRVH